MSGERSAASVGPQSTAASEAHGDPLELGLGPATRVFLNRGDWLFGGELALRYRAFALGIEGLGGGQTGLLGQAYYGLGQGFLRYCLWRVGRTERGLRFGLGVRGAAGLRFAGASPASGVRVNPALVFGWELGADGEVGYRISPDWDLQLHMLGGYGNGLDLTLRTFTGPPEPLVSLSGWSIGASLALALRIADL